MDEEAACTGEETTAAIVVGEVGERGAEDAVVAEAVVVEEVEVVVAAVVVGVLERSHIHLVALPYGTCHA